MFKFTFSDEISKVFTMSIHSKEVFVFKSHSDDEDSYEKVMSDAGLDPKIIPILDFDYCNVSVLRDNIERPSEFSGMILTSPRSVKAVIRCFESPESFPDEWRDRPIFVIGEATKRLLKSELGIRGQCGVTENAVGLAEVIARRTYKQPLLFPCSDIRRDTLPALMLEKGVPLKEIVAYHTKQHPLLEQSLREATSQGQTFPEFIVFFSPSGVKYSLPTLQQLNFRFEKTKVVVIGTTTLKAAEEAGLIVWSCATRPTPQQILNALIESA